MADHRLRMRGAEWSRSFQARGLRAGQAAGIDGAGAAGVAAAPSRRCGSTPSGWPPSPRTWSAAKGHCLVIAGRRQPAGRARAGERHERRAGQRRRTVTFRAPVRHDSSYGVGARCSALVAEIAAGGVDTLVITARNPVYGAPADFKLDKLLERVPETIYHGLYEDETAAASRPSSPRRTASSRGATPRAVDGTVSIMQPLIAPLWGGTTEADVLAAFVGEGDVGAPRAAARSSGRRRAKAGPALTFDGIWESWLADGIVPEHGRAAVEAGLAVDGAALAGASAPLLGARRAAEGLELAFVVRPQGLRRPLRQQRLAAGAAAPDHQADLGQRGADLARRPAKALGLETGDVVEIELPRPARRRRRSARARPRRRRRHAAARLRPQRRRDGRRGVGFNAGALRTSDAPWFDRGVKLTKTGRLLAFAITQDHWSMAPTAARPAAGGRGHARRGLDEGSKFHEELEERRRTPSTRSPSIHKPVDYSSQAYKWGDGDRPQQLHRLQRLRHRLPGREQHPGRRQGGRPQGPRDALDPHRPLLSAGAVERPRRSSSSRCCACTARRRPASTSARSTRPSTAPRASTRWSTTAASARATAATTAPTRCGASTSSTTPSDDTAAREMRHEPGRHRAHARRHGEVHLLRAAHRAQAHRRRASRAARSRDGELETACQQALPDRAPSSSAR